MCISVLMAKKYSQIRGLTPFLKILNPLFVEEDRSKARQAILEHLQHPERPPLVVFPGTFLFTFFCFFLLKMKEKSNLQI